MPKWYQRSNSNSIPSVPWLSPDAVAFLESILQPEFKVLEHGSGGSTIWFSSRVASVTAYEKDVNWFSALNKKKPENVDLRNANRPPRNGEYNLVLIDGEPVEERKQWIRKAVKLVKQGGYIVLDNANRPEYEVERAELGDVAKIVKQVNANEGGTLYLVTEFYQCE